MRLNDNFKHRLLLDPDIVTECSVNQHPIVIHVKEF
jgi:hypothetical protein